MKPSVTPDQHHLPRSPFLGGFHVVLVEPEDSLNVGAVARSMMNLGFERLHLVAPRGYDRQEAARTACWAGPLLDRMEIHDSLDAALGAVQDVIGFSARYSRNRRMHMLLPEWSASLNAAAPRPTALLFGSERTGLRNSDITRCRALVRIPSAEENPSYNLAQAVLLVLYEIARYSQPPELPARVTADANQLQQLDRLVAETLETAGFYRPDSPRSIPGIVSNLLRRAEPDPREAGILLALFSHLRTMLLRS